MKRENYKRVDCCWVCKNGGRFMPPDLHSDYRVMCSESDKEFGETQIMRLCDPDGYCDSFKRRENECA